MITEPIENYGLSKRERKRSLFSRIGIVGCGKDGSSIATVMASSGIEVVFLEPSVEAIGNAFSRIEKKLDDKVAHWGLTESEKKSILSRIFGTLEYVDFKGCDFVIEAVRYEESTGMRSIDFRKDVFRRLEAVLDEDAIIASNVTTVGVTELSNAIEHKERCIGLHFMSNVPDSQTLEVVRGLHTADETFEKIQIFAKMINYTCIEVSESVGLVSLRLFLIELNEACAILLEHGSTVEDIDTILQQGFGNRQGVFRTADQMGIEKIVDLMELLYQEYGNIKYKPSPVLKRLYRAGHYGVSRGRGFYLYE